MKGMIMTRSIRRLLIAAFLASTASQAAARSVYHGLTLLDPVEQTLTPDSYIVIDEGRIVATGSGRPPEAGPGDELHDFSGRYAMPGMIDMHAHISLGPLTGRNVDGKPEFDARGNDSITRHAALMLLAHGITTIRDPGGEAERLVAYRDSVAAGDLLGPEARVAGEIIHRTPFPVTGLIVGISTPSDVAAEVRRQAEAGVDFIKLYEGLTAEDLAAGIAEADRVGLPTIAHLSDVSWTRAAELGVDSLVHAIPISPELLPSSSRVDYLSSRRPASYPFFEWYEHVDLGGPEINEMISALAQRRIWVDATLIAFHVAFRGNDPATRDRDLWAAHPSFAANWQTRFRFDLGWQESDYARAQAIWPKVLQLVRMLHEAGVPMTLGTDMNNPFVAPGASFAREMQLHADAGLPNWAILRMATSEAARALGLEKQIGRLRSGMEADILFLSADPTKDLAATATPASVMVNGRLYDPATLRSEAAAVAASAGECGDGCTPEALVAALYDAVSADPGEGWDRSRIRNLFVDDAKLVTAMATPTGTRSSMATIDEFVAAMEQHYRATGVDERELRGDSRTIGDIASVYSSFELKAGSDPSAKMRGLNHFQLVRSDGRWRIVSNVAVMDAESWRLPPRFQP
jgi:hypothetical protein